MNREQRRKSKYGAGPWIKPKLAKNNIEYLGDFGGIFAVCIKREISIGGGVFQWFSNDTRFEKNINPFRVALISPEKGKEDNESSDI